MTPAVIPSGAARGWLVVGWSLLNGGLPSNETTVAGAALSTNADSVPWSGTFTAVQRLSQDQYLDSILPYALPGNFRVSQRPSVALDPTNPLRVYIAFCGTTDHHGQSATNTDIYIARGTINPAPPASISFLNGQGNPDVIRLTDSIMEPPGTGETDQFLPEITVDQYGKIHMIYLRYEGPDNVQHAFGDVYYARIASFDNPSSGLYQARLTPSSFEFGLGPSADMPLYGDYIGITSSGCYVYLCYPACYELDPTDTNGPRWGWYVHRVYLVNDCTAGDFNANGDVNSGDMLDYAGAYTAMHPLADWNGDGVIDIRDFLAFTSDWSSSSGTTP